MTEPNKAQDTEIRQLIADIKRARVIGFVVFCVAALIGVALALACDAANKPRLVPVVMVPSLGISALALIRVFSSKCPACGKLFFGAPVRALYASSCYYCKSNADTAQQSPPGDDLKAAPEE